MSSHKVRVPKTDSVAALRWLMQKWMHESETLDIHPAGLAARRVCATELEATIAPIRAEIEVLRADRDALREALERILPQYEALLRDCGLASEHTIDQARDALEQVAGRG